MGIALAILVSACLLAALFLGLDRLASASRARGAAGASPRPGKGAANIRECPLCSSALGPGERVKSSLFPGKADRIMYIYGCAHCWPATPASRATSASRRICPVCGQALDAKGWVIARYFERPGRSGKPERRHVHVLGCTGCRG